MAMSEKKKVIFSSLVHGKLLMMLRADRYLPQIVFTFFMALFVIWVNIKIDSTLRQMEENKKTLENLQSVYTSTKCRLTSLDSVSKVEDMLQDMGSNVAIPTKQATIIDK